MGYDVRKKIGIGAYSRSGGESEKIQIKTLLVAIVNDGDGLGFSVVKALDINVAELAKRLKSI